jgi:hypothetical protein
VTAGNRTRAASCGILALFLFSFSATADAQTTRVPPRVRQPRLNRTTPHAGSLEVSGGLVWQNGFDAAPANAELTRNPTTGTDRFDLFTADSRLGSGVGVQGRIAGYLSSHVAVEGGVRLTRPKLDVRLSNDFESAPNVTANETMTLYVFEGSAVWNFAPLHGGRIVPFVAGGAGYIRDVHEGSELIETGTEYHGLVGIKWWFSNHPHRLGLRAEGGFSTRDGGFDFRDGRRTVPIVTAGVAYLF